MADFCGEFLQQGLQHDVILMVMGDQGVVDGVGQVGVAVAGQAVGLVVADQGINEDGDILGFDQDAGMAKVANADRRRQCRAVGAGADKWG